MNIQEAFFELVRNIPRQGVEYKLVVVGGGGVGKVVSLFTECFPSLIYFIERDRDSIHTKPLR